MPGGTTKLGPLANTDLCALVKGLLERLITHFGLGSSVPEEPRGLYCLLGGRGLVPWEPALLEASEALAWEDSTWEATLSLGEIALTARVGLPAWEALLSLGEIVLTAREVACLGKCKDLSLAEHLTASLSPVEALPA